MCDTNPTMHKALAMYITNINKIRSNSNQIVPSCASTNVTTNHPATSYYCA